MILSIDSAIFIIGGYDYESGMTHVVLVDEVDLKNVVRAKKNLVFKNLKWKLMFMS